MQTQLAAGTPAAIFLTALVHDLGVTSIELIEYPVFPDLEQRIATQEAIVALPVHDETGRSVFELKTHALAEVLRQMTGAVKMGNALGISSRIRDAHGAAGHIPMMDFCCDVSENARSFLVTLLKETFPWGGALLYSGKSYHYYGARIIRNDEWPIFMGKCLLLSTFVDARYVGHRLIEGFCVLRISASTAKPHVPRLVEAWSG